MSLHKQSETKWEREFSVGNYNESHEIEVTKDGIVMDYDLLTWEEIDKAREIIKEKGGK